MSLNDNLSNVLSHILTEEKNGRQQVTIKPNCKVTRNVLKIMQQNSYVGEVQEVKDDKAGYILINLIGAINKCGVIKPRFNVKVGNYKKFEKRYLPAFGFGILIVSTSKGIMTHEDAIKNNLGGKLIAYVY